MGVFLVVVVSPNQEFVVKRNHFLQKVVSSKIERVEKLSGTTNKILEQ